MIRIKLFGIARDIVGQGSLVIESGVSNVGELLAKVQADYPEFNRLTSLLVAVNEEYAELTDPIKENDEVALIPPVSGG
jgi:molybdopterin converting factor subunit 1